MGASLSMFHYIPRPPRRHLAAISPLSRAWRSAVMTDSRRTILRDAWRIARPYWFSEERWFARGLLAALIVMMLAQVWVNLRINSWRNDFYNTLQTYDERGFFWQLAIFITIAMGSVLLSVFELYLQQLLEIRWRRWMTDVYLREWLGDQTYYRLQLTTDA